MPDQHQHPTKKSCTDKDMDSWLSVCPTLSIFSLTCQTECTVKPLLKQSSLLYIEPYRTLNPIPLNLNIQQFGPLNLKIEQFGLLNLIIEQLGPLNNPQNSSME